MSETATELIRTFSTLSPQERHAVLIELVRISEAGRASIASPSRKRRMSAAKLEAAS